MTIGVAAQSLSVDSVVVGFGFDDSVVVVSTVPDVDVEAEVIWLLPFRFCSWVCSSASSILLSPVFSVKHRAASCSYLSRSSRMGSSIFCKGAVCRIGPTVAWSRGLALVSQVQRQSGTRRRAAWQAFGDSGTRIEHYALCSG